LIMVAFSFNAHQFEPKYGGGNGLPPGRYKGIISAIEAKPTKKGDGGYAQFSLKVIEGPLAGQVQFDNLGLWNSNSQTVEIANKQLSAYCHVVGVYVVQDLDQLCNNVPLQFEVRPQKDNPQYMEVGAIWDINGFEPGKAGVAQAQPAPAAPPPVVTAAPVVASTGGWVAQPNPAAPVTQPAAAPAWVAPGAPAAPVVVAAQPWTAQAGAAGAGGPAPWAK